MYLSEELLKILDLFEHYGIDVIPFKGPILGEVAYGDLALRMISDLDLFVRKEDVPAANDLFCSQGFQPQYRLDSFERNANLQGPGACHFMGGKTNIDLHWEIAPRIFTYDFDPYGYWSRLQPVSIGRKEIPALSMEDRLLMLCGHGVRNTWSQLVWICDVSETILQMSPADWDRTYEQVISLGSEDILHFGLSLAISLMEVDLPENIQDQIRSDSNIDLLVHQVRNRLLQEHNYFSSGSEWLRFQLRVRQQFMDKVRFLWRLATTPNVDDLVRIQLPSWLSFLYLFHRAVRLMGKYVLSPLGQKSKDRISI